MMNINRCYSASSLFLFSPRHSCFCLFKAVILSLIPMWAFYSSVFQKMLLTRYTDYLKKNANIR